MKRLFWIPLVILGAVSAWANGRPEPTLTIDAEKTTGTVSPILYGLMTEDINHAYDGGLYAELIQNRAFLDNSRTAEHWSLVHTGSASASMALDTTQPLSAEVPVSLKVTVTGATSSSPAGIANDGYWGIPVRPDTVYHVSFYARSDGDYSGNIDVAVQSTDGTTTYAAGDVAGISRDWKQYQLTIKTGTVPTTDKARFVVQLNQAGTVWFGLVSLFPPTWDNQPNGFRKDIMQMLVDLHPKFLRFPGGNFLEGKTVATRFDWKKTIGPLTGRPGHNGPWGYRSTDGLGLLEFLKWCEDMHARPVLAVYAGYSLNGEHVNPEADLEPFVQSALDEIEYVSGPPTSKWGAQRARYGHPAPFELQYVEIGNEDWFDRSGSYDQRFAQFYDAIKAKYPAINVISTIGNAHPAIQRVQSRTPDVLDEHYYQPAGEFITDSPGHFKSYDKNGPEIFVGEWASYETAFPPWDVQSEQQPPTPDMAAALGDAAWMAAMERNSDLVIMQCYAPLLVNVNPGARQWRPDLIGYDALTSFGSPSYYAIEMFSTNVGNQILETSTSNTKVQTSVTRNSDTGEIDVKLVNPNKQAVDLRIDIHGGHALAPSGTAVAMAAPPDATNSIDDPTHVVPETSSLDHVGARFRYAVPGNSIVVLKLASR